MIWKIGRIINLKITLISYMLLFTPTAMPTFLPSMVEKAAPFFFLDVTLWTSGIGSLHHSLSGLLCSAFPFHIFLSILYLQSSIKVLSMLFFSITNKTRDCLSLQIGTTLSYCYIIWNSN